MQLNQIQLSMKLFIRICKEFIVLYMYISDSINMFIQYTSTMCE